MAWVQRKLQRVLRRRSLQVSEPPVALLAYRVGKEYQSICNAGRRSSDVGQERPQAASRLESEDSGPGGCSGPTDGFEPRRYIAKMYRIYGSYSGTGVSWAP